MKERHDNQHFVEEFSGDSRHVLDFLADDVLALAPPATRDFLLRTSVLGRLMPELCDAVLETTNSAAMLAEIARKNLFVVPLDGPGTEYRYHQLFEAMLVRELRASDPSAPAELHARASTWFETRGDIEAAIEHAIASGDVARSSDLVIRHATTYWASGRLATVSRWLAALSWPEARADPKLAIVRAQMAGLAASGRDDIESWLAVAESAADSGPLANGFASIRSAVAVLRSAYLTGGIDVAERSSRLGLELEPRGSPWRYQMLVTLGQALYLAGKSDAARLPLEEARTMPGASTRAPAAALGLAYLALISLESGTRDDAESIARAAIALLDEHHLGSSVAAVNPHLALGCALMETPDVHAAAEHLARAVELAAPGAPSYLHAHALIRSAAALHRLGDTAAADESLAKAAADLDSLPNSGMLGELYNGMRDAIAGRQRREGFLGDDLSEAEIRIVQSLMAGSSLNEVARELYLSPNTVKTHRRTIYRKLGVSTRDEFIDRATELGIGSSAAID